MKKIKISLTVALIASLNITASERSSLLDSKRPGYGTTIQTPYRPFLNIQGDEPAIEAATDLAALETEAVIADDLSNAIQLLEQSKDAARDSVRKYGTYRDKVLFSMESLGNTMLQSLAVKNQEVLKRHNFHQEIKRLLSNYLEQSQAIHKELIDSKGFLGRRSSSSTNAIDEKIEALKEINEAILNKVRIAKELKRQEQKKAHELYKLQKQITEWEEYFTNPKAYLDDSTYQEIKSLCTNNLIGEAERSRLNMIMNYLDNNYTAGCDYLYDYSIYWSRNQ